MLCYVLLSAHKLRLRNWNSYINRCCAMFSHLLTNWDSGIGTAIYINRFCAMFSHLLTTHTQDREEELEIRPCTTLLRFQTSFQKTQNSHSRIGAGTLGAVLWSLIWRTNKQRVKLWWASHTQSPVIFLRRNSVLSGICPSAWLPSSQTMDPGLYSTQNSLVKNQQLNPRGPSQNFYLKYMSHF